MSRSVMTTLFYFLVAIVFALAAVIGNTQNPRFLWFCAAIFAFLGAFRLYLTRQRRK